MRTPLPTPAALLTTATRLGLLLVAETALGVTAIWLGDDERAVRDALAAARPDLRLDRPVTASLRDAMFAIARHADGDDPPPSLPVDVRGTPWQRRVWDAVGHIPRGHTASYGALAQRLGCPQSARAVARACAANDLALLTPCHRVVRGDGAPGGYRWGADRKALLLERESRA
jgi:AraC family transcriptional regulator of adaptative response/methylated-DNA-[protein]-cysteine methyltransferase